MAFFGKPLRAAQRAQRPVGRCASETQRVFSACKSNVNHHPGPAHRATAPCAQSCSRVLARPGRSAPERHATLEVASSGATRAWSRLATPADGVLPARLVCSSSHTSALGHRAHTAARPAAGCANKTALPLLNEQPQRSAKGRGRARSSGVLERRVLVTLVEEGIRGVVGACWGRRVTQGAPETWL